jgi:hypothetical protein
MLRRAAAVVLVLTLNPASLLAQDIVLTVNVPSADVYKGPSNVTPVIGHVPRGMVLYVARNLGSWVKIAWPQAPDGVGYVHVTMGRIGPRTAETPSPSAAPRAAAAPAAMPPTAVVVSRTSVGESVVPRGQLNMTPASHIFGVGGLIGPVGSPSGFGATARVWRNNHLGIQLGITRDSMTSSIAAGRVTTMQFEPGVVVGLFDRVSDYVWLRPYIGSIVSMRRQRLSVVSPVAAEPVTDTGMGYRVFAGSELMFSSLPRFGLSADLGYRHDPQPFPGFELDPLSVSIAGHWYIK